MVAVERERGGLLTVDQHVAFAGVPLFPQNVQSSLHLGAGKDPELYEEPAARRMAPQRVSMNLP